jgi:endonuclease/exonuclease/phosphatase family metal-dependent hydrolase
VLVLSWNLFHGRAQPAAGGPLAAEFAAALAGWEWDVALLQETPPWWPARLAAAAGATARRTLTSRTSLLPARRAVASRNPDLLAAAGGGCNAILVRGTIAIAEHRERELTRRPERRTMQGIRLDGAGWVVNLHASTHPPEQRRADLLVAAATALEWAAGGPLVFGGDLNSTQPAMPGLVHIAGHHVDHVFTEGRAAAGPVEVLDAAPLSDHSPLRVSVS